MCVRITDAFVPLFFPPVNQSQGDESGRPFALLLTQNVPEEPVGKKDSEHAVRLISRSGRKEGSAVVRMTAFDSLQAGKGLCASVL